MLIDSTLREGAQRYGTHLSLEARKDILVGLLHLGVEEIELGWVGQDGLEELAAWAKTRVAEPARGKGASPGTQRTTLSVWSPCREPDIRAAAGLGLDRVNMGVPVSDQHIRLRLGLDRPALLDNLARAVLFAKLVGIPYLSVGLEDISRTGEEFALKAALLAVNMGAARIRLADTVGLLTPLDMAGLAGRFVQALQGRAALAVHCHDDFGLATANALTALDSGADYADASLLGLGERTGIAATEELAALLRLRRGQGYDLSRIQELCARTAYHAGVTVPASKAVAGADIFASESGLHVHGLHKSPALFEPFDPALIGARRTLAVGAKSGRGALRASLEAQGLGSGGCADLADPENKRRGAGPAPDRLGPLLDTVRREAARLGRPLRPEELAVAARERG